MKGSNEMATCKDCFSCEICKKRDGLVQLDIYTWDTYSECSNVEDLCKSFKSNAEVEGYENRIKTYDTEIDILIRKNETLKDEICRLQNILVGFMGEVGTWSNKYDVDISNIHKLPLLAKEDYNIRNKIKHKGIKEFWNKLKQKKQWDVDISDYVLVDDGDNLVKEMGWLANDIH